MRASNVQIDKNALEQFVSEHCKSQSDFGLKMHRSQSTYFRIHAAGYCSRVLYENILYYYGLPEGALMPKKAEKPEIKPENGSGYSTSVRVFPNKVQFDVLFDGEVIYTGWSKVRGETETDLMQAISYAAHMCYKKSEEASLKED